MFAFSRGTTPGQLEARLGLLNGVLIGLALALGAWGWNALAARGTLSPLWYGSLLLGLVVTVAVSALAGWLAAVSGKASFSLLIWCGASLASTWVIGHLAYEGSTLLAWLLDKRFWGLPIYPYIPAALVRQVMAGFFVVLLLSALGLFQPYRLEGLSGTLTADRRLTGRAWFLLLLPLPLVLGCGIIADNLINQPLRSSVAVVDEVLRVGRAYEGDLFQLGLERGINYNAVAGIRDRMSSDYTLSIGEIDLGAAAMVFVVVHFDNATWLNCRVVAEQLSHCWDARPPYERGLPALLSGRTIEDCLECTVVPDEAARISLAAQTPFNQLPEARRLAQQGSYVWMRVESPTGDQVVDCLLRGISPVRLVKCQAVTAPEVRLGRTPGLMALAPSTGTPVPAPGLASPEEMREPGPSDGPLGMATPDRLAAPPTVYPPTQADLGAQVYWFKCMVCHGDRGQGLTEEWRNAWDPSHRNCWQSRCHASNHPPEGFQLPYYAPPLIGPGTLARHGTLADLHDYLATQMPWQAPGSLPPEEYWQLAAFLLRANGVAVSDADLNPAAAARVRLVRVVSASGNEQETAVGVFGAQPLLLGFVAPTVAGVVLAILYARSRRR